MKRENAWNPNQGGHRGLPLPQAPVGAAPVPALFPRGRPRACLQNADANAHPREY